MKPSAYMPFYGNDFFQAVIGLPDTVGMAYLKLIWHYWSHKNCEGLNDDSESLRKIAGVDKAEWEEVSQAIFGPLFVMRADGKWHQERAAEEWEKSNKAYKNACERAKMGAKERWKGHKKKI